MIAALNVLARKIGGESPTNGNNKTQVAGLGEFFSGREKNVK
jgi:hypothetical protein